MSRRRLYTAVTGVVLAAIVSLVLVFGVFQGQPSATTGKEADAESADRAQEAVEVHGHWTIEVREPDGSLVSRHEFDNAIYSQAKGLMSDILTRDLTTGIWYVILTGIIGPGPFVDENLQPVTKGYITENDNPGSESGYFFKTLIADSPGKIVLTGTATVALDDAIGFCGTSLSSCGPSVAPSDCHTYGALSFSQSTLDPAIPVSAGQQILVEVVIDFL